MKQKLIVIAIAAALPLSALAQNGNPTSPSGSPSKAPMEKAAPGGAQGSSSLDANKDGFISREEAKASATISSRFNELDKDHDGKLSAQELSGASSGGGASPSNSSSPRPGGGEPKTRY